MDPAPSPRSTQEDSFWPGKITRGFQSPALSCLPDLTVGLGSDGDRWDNGRDDFRGAASQCWPKCYAPRGGKLPGPPRNHTAGNVRRAAFRPEESGAGNCGTGEPGEKAPSVPSHGDVPCGHSGYNISDTVEPLPLCGRPGGADPFFGCGKGV